jgi:ABC-2 type transport system permease protein
MLIPRWSVGLCWALVVTCIVVGPMFGPSLGLSRWLRDVSPFTFVPNAPAVSISLGPILGLVLASALLATLAAMVLRHRNIVLPA